MKNKAIKLCEQLEELLIEEAEIQREHARKMKNLQKRRMLAMGQLSTIVQMLP